jgi:hypothetical protein
MTIELVPLCTLTAELKDPFAIGATPAGTRLIFEVASAKVEGARLSGQMKGSALADWFTIGPDSTGTVDVRGLMETDDGALVYIQYQGRTDLSAGQGPIYIAPRFETGEPRYAWLNRVQAVGKGELTGQTLVYEIYEVV